MPGAIKRNSVKSESLKKSGGSADYKSGLKAGTAAVKKISRSPAEAVSKNQKTRKSVYSTSPDKSLRNLAVYVKRLEKENSILAKELIQKKERRLELPILDHEDTRMAMARLNLRITETESLMAHQKQGLTAVKGIISAQEKRMNEITNRIEELQGDVSKNIIQPQEAKLQLEGLLRELQKLRSRREQAQAGIAV